MEDVNKPKKLILIAVITVSLYRVNIKSCYFAITISETAFFPKEFIMSDLCHVSVFSILGEKMYLSVIY